MSFFLLIGRKLYWSARACLQSTNWPAISPVWMQMSLSWWIWHCCETTWSMFEAKYSRNHSALILAVMQSSGVAPAGFNWLNFLWPVMSRNSRHAPFCYHCTAGTPWRQNHEFRDSQKSRNSSYWSVVDHSKVDVFRVTMGGFGIRASNAGVRAASGSGSGAGWSSIGEALITEILKLSVKTSGSRLALNV